jgi:hypothetical protein
MFRTLSVAVLAGGLAGTSALADTLFDNTATDLNIRLNVAGGNSAANTQVGDEILLSGTSDEYFMTSLKLQYWASGSGLSGNAELFVYANDGVLFNGSKTPGTLLFDSGTFQITDTARSTLTFGAESFGATGLMVPKDFTYAIRFTGLTPTGSAGVDLYNPPTTGQDFDDYWYLNGSTWELRTQPGNPVNFAAQVLGTPVPEPSTMALVAIGGMVLLWRRKLAR